MPRSSPGTPGDWLRHAKSDLAIAASPPSADVLLETLCYHTQQAVEKAFKAILVFSGLEPPRTHNIATLASLFPESLLLPSDLVGVVELTDYAVTARYPGDFEEITPEELAQAAALAKRAVDWASSIIGC